MVKRLLLLVLYVSPTIVFGQGSELIQVYYQNSKILKEKYEVINAREQQKNGPYFYYFKNKKVRLEGHYQNGKKDGEWTHYNDQGNIRTVAHYKSGEKVGIWLDYMADGKIVRRFDYDKKEALEPLFPTIQIEYPTRGREDEIEGTVTLKFLFDENCAIKAVIPINTLGKDFEQVVIDGFREGLNIRKKYNVELEGCAVGEQIFSVNFALN